MSPARSADADRKRSGRCDGSVRNSGGGTPRSPPMREGKGLQPTSAPARCYAVPRFSPANSFGSAFVSMQATKRILPCPRAAGMCAYREPLAPRPHLAQPAAARTAPPPPPPPAPTRTALRGRGRSSAGLLRTGCGGDARPRSFALQLILSRPPRAPSDPVPGARVAPSPAVRTRGEGRGVLPFFSRCYYGCTVVICESLPKRAARPRGPQRSSAPGPFSICISVG